ncbi:hypothetical protein ACHQM5_024940 [Ranunculus cassubicifolius]
MSARSASQNYRQTQNNKTQQKRFVPKSQNQPTPPPPLSTSLRQQQQTLIPSSTAINPSSSSSRVSNGGGGGGKFVNYLPQDEAVATGLGVEDGALIFLILSYLDCSRPTLEISGNKWPATLHCMTFWIAFFNLGRDGTTSLIMEPRI